MTTRPSIVFCISGQIRDDQITFPRLAELARAHGATVILSTWRRRGTKTSGVINRDQILRMFGPEVGDAFPNDMVGGSRFNEALPEFEAGLLRRFAEVTAEQVLAHFPEAILDIEDETMSLDFAAPVPQDRNSLRMLYKIWRCNEIKRREERRRGAPFDLVVRFRPDVVPDLADEVMSPILGASEPTLFVPGGKPDAGYLDDVMAISSSPVADSFAALFAKCLAHPARPWALIHHEMPRHLKEHGIAIGAAKLNSWITEDFASSQPRNRAHLMELLAADQINPTVIADPVRRADIVHLLTAANHLAQKRNRHAVESELAAVNINVATAEVVARIAGLCGAARHRFGDPAGWIAATLIQIYILTDATDGKYLTSPEAHHRLRLMHRAAPRQGLGQLPFWRLVERIAACAFDSPLLGSLVNAALRTLGPERIAQAEQLIAAALHSLEPETAAPSPGDWHLRTQAGQDLQKAVVMAADAIAVAPSSPWAHCALADLLLERGSAEAADAAYHAALQCPGSTPDIAAMLSVARSRKGDLAGAVSAARDARNGAPENVQFVMRHAALLDAAKEFAAAEAAWREASARMPSDPVPLRQLAISLHNAGRVPEATVAAQAAIALAPDDPDLASFLGAQPGTQPAGAELRAHSPVADAPKPPPLPAPTLQLVSAPSSEPEPPKPAGDPTPPTTRAWQVLTSQAPEDAGPAAPPAPKPGLLRRLFGAKR